MPISNRNRAHPPTLFTVEELIVLEPMVRLTALGLRHFADDEGRETANPTIIRGQLWPLEPSVTDETINEHLILLEDAGWLQLYTADGKTLFQITDWPRVDRGQKSRFPAPPEPRERCSQPVLATCARKPYAVEEREGEREESEREDEREGEGGGARAERAARRSGQEPSPFCSDHPTGTEKPCGKCMTARLRQKEWLKGRLDVARQQEVDDD